ncbi:hypothetical protein [Umezawaea sp. Da 62-37]|uniref:hypothetical protein n=1 Tax=Umezawaea sp. Da 62-37 TaxID=3075927 RepID=UPI0028F6C9E6|nr:hypothetical protein [Umezawaea sp. Da 62-37]WNV86049.1 hypothetical protein RM788_49385 [Umezawaea sp. Da 62-37]
MRLAGVQTVQPGHLVAELVREVRQRQAGVHGRARRDDAQRRRQAAAVLHQPGDRGGLGGDPPRAEPRAEQVHRLGPGQRLQRHGARPVPHDQPGQQVAARHDRGAGRAAGQQRGDLVGLAALSRTASIRLPATRLR